MVEMAFDNTQEAMLGVHSQLGRSSFTRFCHCTVHSSFPNGNLIIGAGCDIAAIVMAASSYFNSLFIMRDKAIN